MFKKIVDRLKNLTRTPGAVDPATFNDPIASKTQWTPAKEGGASFKTRKLVEVSPLRMEFRVSVAAFFLGGLFMLVGLGIAAVMTVVNLNEVALGFNVETILPLFIGLIFALTGGCILYFGMIPVVFDKRSGYFFKSRKTPDRVFDQQGRKDYVPLEKIHALQLISEHCSGNKSSFYSYEINIVLSDGSRVNVIDHGDKKQIREDARKLTQFLGDKPVWDAI